MIDTTLLKYYMQGFKDELFSKKQLVFDDSSSEHSLAKMTYELGRKYVINADDLHSVDYLSNDEILNRIVHH